MQRRLRFLPTLMLAALLGLLLHGCSLARLDDNLPYGILNNNDLPLVKEGLPTYLLLIDGMIENWPESQSMLSTGASLYSAYAGLFVDDEQRARKLSRKALDYALRAACQHDGDYCQAEQMDVSDFQERVAGADKGDVAMLFTLGSTWAGYIEANANDWNAIAKLSQVKALMSRVVELDEGHEHGQAHMYLAVLDSILPASLGGKPEQARQHFEKAVSLSDGDNLLAKVLFAEDYARLVFDRELHDRLLEEVLAADTKVHGLTLQNTYAQQQAKALLASADDYF